MFLVNKDHASQWHDIGQSTASTEVAMESRIWSQAEYIRMTAACLENNEFHLHRTSCIVLAYYAGLRLEEIFRLDIRTTQTAIDCGFITIKNPFGAMRKVPINFPVRIQLEKLQRNAKCDRQLFGPNNKSIEAAKEDFASFFNQNWRNAAGSSSLSPLTFKGLRNTCAINWCRALRRKGMPDDDARCQITSWMGWDGDWYV